MELAELVAALRPSEAMVLIQHQRVDSWCDKHDVVFTRDVLKAVIKRASDPEEIPPPPPPDPRRRDTEALQQFVSKAVKLPPRVRQVAALCLDQGFTLDQCAAQLGIKRETVRVHLRRLRTMRKRAAAMRGERVGRG
jgi:RNA polymerase sigma factor (sigma-70 family)